jgi:DNA-binding beta-propeller fold protein YncE
MESKSKPAARTLFILFLLALLTPGTAAAGARVRVIVDNASIKATPEIGSPTLANVALGTILDVEMKKGEWYKITITKAGQPLAGYIHELLVEEVGEGEAPAVPPPGGVIKSQGEISAEIELKMEESKNLIRQDKDLDRAAEDLRPLLAKAFSLDDHVRQKQIACEIYLWLGLASAKRGDNYGALKEFQNMFDVDYPHANELTRNIYDPAVASFIDQAEKQYRGVLVEYSLEITSEPKEAAILIDGREVGRTPEVFTTPIPKFTLELHKEGFGPYKEEVFLSQASSKKEIVLRSIGRTIQISSAPAGAQLFLDDQDTGKVTDCELPYVPYGGHTLKLKKPGWADYEQAVEVAAGQGPLTITAALTVKDYGIGLKLGGTESRPFRLPKAIAFDKEGFFYVADESDNKIKKFDSQGRQQSGWGDSGREFRALKKPSGIAVDGQGFIYITDAEAGCVTKFSKAGKFVSKWGKQGSKPDELMGPLGIAVDRGGDIYVADSGNSRIVKYSTGGVVKTSWGRSGMDQGEFVFPSGVAVSPQNEIIVVDRVHIQRFTPEGAFVAAWGKSGSGDGELSRPLGMTMDPQGYIYVADTGNNRILKFDLSGRFLVKWGSAGTKDGQMMAPAAVGVDEKGNVFVVEIDNNRVQEFTVPTQ